jgi:hypothetical protein
MMCPVDNEHKSIEISTSTRSYSPRSKIMRNETLSTITLQVQILPLRKNEFGISTCFALTYSHRFFPKPSYVLVAL